MDGNADRDVYDKTFVTMLFERFHDRPIDEADAEGLVGLLGPIEALAERGATGLDFDDEPADFVRVMHEQRRPGDEQ